MINYNETKKVLSMEEDGRTNTVHSSPPSAITGERDANTPEAASNRCKEWFISIMGEDDLGDDLQTGSKHRIQKVSARLREKENNKSYFHPRVVSLGPYHHGEDHLKPMEKHKITAAKRFVDETMVKRDRTQVGGMFCEKLMKVIEVAKECYAAEVVENFTDDYFARMMFLDGCFVLYFIQGMNKGGINLEVSNDHIPLIVRDMFLVENQVPFEVLDALMSSSRKWKREILEFVNRKVLVPMGMFYLVGPESPDLSRDGKVPLHLLDVLRTILLDFLPSKMTQKRGFRQRNFGSVMELKEAGIRFEKSYNRCMMGIRFEKNFLLTRLLLPQMRINDVTVSHLMNLTAFEVCSDEHYGCGVSSYICFLNSLIGDAADVKELRSKGILSHTLSSDEEVARLFNEWPIQAKENLKLYSDVKTQIALHRRSREKQSIVRWLNTHFGDQWIAVSSFGAILLLIFTFIQTICSVLTSVRS